MILIYFNDRSSTLNWFVLKPLDKLSDKVTNNELKKYVHKMICPNYELTGFVGSYRRASGIKSIHYTTISEMRLNTLLKNTAPEPFSISVVRICILQSIVTVQITFLLWLN